MLRNICEGHSKTGNELENYGQHSSEDETYKDQCFSHLPSLAANDEKSQIKISANSETFKCLLQTRE